MAAIVGEAEQVDAAEDALFGVARGDELPPSWHGRAGRRERLRAAMARLEAEQAAQRAEQERVQRERAAKHAAALAAAQAALTAEVSAREEARQAWEQQWEAAAADPATPAPRGAAPKPAEQSSAVVRARDRVERARRRVDDPAGAPRPGRGRRNPEATGRRRRSPPSP